MLKRFFVHLCFALLFALTQIGVAAHPISHFHDVSTQSQHDKNTAAEHCEQCIGYAHADQAIATPSFWIPQNLRTLVTAKVSVAKLTTALTRLYSARAPPVSLS